MSPLNMSNSLKSVLFSLKELAKGLQVPWEMKGSDHKGRVKERRGWELEVRQEPSFLLTLVMHGQAGCILFWVRIV